MDANVFTDSWDFEREGAAAATLGGRAGTELLGASVYELQPGSRWAICSPLRERGADRRPRADAPHARRQPLSRGRGRSVPARFARCPPLTNDSDATADPDRLDADDAGGRRVPGGGNVFVMTESPYTSEPYDAARGRIVRVFDRDGGRPIPPDE